MTSTQGRRSGIDWATQRGPLRTSVLLLSSLSLLRLLIQFAGINHYGWFRDELYYMACGQHLAWGYVDQPPLIAVIAWFARHAFGNSMFAVRLLPALAGAAVVFLAGWIAREFGGGLFAQFLASLAMLFAPAYLAFDSFLSMNAFEPLFWTLCALIVIRVAKGGPSSLWLLFGAVAGIGLENKHTMLVFGFAIVGGLLISSERRLLDSKWLWVGGAIALAIFLPNLIWEARNGWPQIEVVRAGQEYKNYPVGPFRFLFEQILFLQPVELPVWLAGLAWFFAMPEGKRFRFFGWAYLIVMAIFIVLHGKTYYPLPFYPILMAAGGVAFGQLLFAGASETIVSVRLLRGDRDRRTGFAAIRSSTSARRHFYTLLTNTSVLSHGKDGAGRDGRLAAALCRHVWLGKYGCDRGSRLSRSSAGGATKLRDSGGKLWGGGRDRLLRPALGAPKSDQRPQQLFSVGAAQLLR